MRAPDSKKRTALRPGGFAFPSERKEPPEGASHVCNRLARFSQANRMSIVERAPAWKCIASAAGKFVVEAGVTARPRGRVH